MNNKDFYNSPDGIVSLLILVDNGLFGAGLSHIKISKEVRDISLKEAVEDYEKLKITDYTDYSNIGNKAMDYFFFKHRLETKAKKGLSFFDWLKTNPLNKRHNKQLYEYNLKTRTHYQSLFYTYRLYQGSITAFKPLTAKKLYQKFNPKTVLDFSAGWGGRCLGAMVLDINYIGFDTNTNLKSAYKNMIKSYPSKSDVNIIFQDSSKADFSKYDYDMVFTSPPYFFVVKPTEVYQNMPVYKDREEYYNKFLFPVITNSYKNLKKGGVYALNIPIDMYQDVKKILGSSKQKIPLRVKDRFNKKENAYKEYIYVWMK
jgi:cyclopropane fatty-acyl-phospholipid synthase-like methyltransferase